jgi:hypothetical protein
MQHDKHGRHPAVGAEVEQLKRDGWTFYVKNNKSSDEHLKLIKAPISEAFPIIKRGRPKKV